MGKGIRRRLNDGSGRETGEDFPHLANKDIRLMCRMNGACACLLACIHVCMHTRAGVHAFKLHLILRVS